MGDIRLIALDMDGTLLGADHCTIPRRNLDALRAAAARGVKIAIASGRSWSLIRETAQTLGCVSYALTANGSFTMETATGREVTAFPIPTAQTAAAIQILRRRNIAFELYIGPDNFIEPQMLQAVSGLGFSPDFEAMFRRNTTLHPDLLQLIETAPPQKFDIFFVPHHLRPALMEELRSTGALSITGAEGTNMELTAPGVNKGMALAALAGQLGLGPEQVMACGDSDNDLEMLRWAHWSFAMENAIPETRAAARFITGPNHLGGVGMAVEAHVLNK